jgi:exodeoxyribonuclease VII large subunit
MELLDNLPELSVSELSNQVKRTVETSFDRVRVRGEISRPSFAASGHVYLTLKDDKAVLDGVVWRGNAQRLSVRPEEGMEVICTGKITTYPGRSKYQMVIEQMELAGEGALLKLLEDRRRKLAAEGLFDEDRKRALPFLPRVIGVVTSPTGAVIRDILHRLTDRFPVHVLVVPVLVQGENAKTQIAAAIRGFNAMPEGGVVPRPDLLIVARGGGSLEDLWSFNEEEVVRAAAESEIPLISAVGHETDTTLIDFASDRRAPTPTAAAEIAVPVRSELLAQVMDDEGRLLNAVTRRLGEARTRLDGMARGLGDPRSLIESRAQTVDYLDQRLAAGMERGLDQRAMAVARLADRLPRPETQLARIAGDLAVLSQRLEAVGERFQDSRRSAFERVAARLRPEPITRAARQASVDLERGGARLEAAMDRGLSDIAARLGGLDGLLRANSFERTLDRGFALVRDDAGVPVLSASEAKPGQAVSLQFKDGEASAVIGARARRSGARSAKQEEKPEAKPAAKQETLF